MAGWSRSFRASRASRVLHIGNNPADVEHKDAKGYHTLSEQEIAGVGALRVSAVTSLARDPDSAASGPGLTASAIFRHAMLNTIPQRVTGAKARCLLCATCILLSSPIAATGWADSSDFAAVVRQARQGTVGILTHATSSTARTGGFSVRGSGLYLGDGYILTARHATIQHAGRHDGGHPGDPPRITVISNALEEVSATLVGVNHFLDLALYRIAHDLIPRGLSAQQFAQAEALPGERVFTVGYPLGWGPAVSYGYVGNPQTFLSTVESRLVQVDLSACSGNSGGGLFNAHGDIVGIVHAIIHTDTTHSTPQARRCSRFAFAVPGPLAHKIVTALIQGTPLHFSTLGLRLASVKIGHQWRVAVARATGPAQRAGIRTGDVLLSIDEHRVESAGQLKHYVIEHTQPFQPVTMRILRDDREHVLRVVPGKARDAVQTRPPRRPGTPPEHPSTE